MQSYCCDVIIMQANLAPISVWKHCCIGDWSVLLVLYHKLLLFSSPKLNQNLPPFTVNLYIAIIAQILNYVNLVSIYWIHCVGLEVLWRIILNLVARAWRKKGYVDRCISLHYLINIIFCFRSVYAFATSHITDLVSMYFFDANCSHCDRLTRPHNHSESILMPMTSVTLYHWRLLHSGCKRHSHFLSCIKRVIFKSKWSYCNVRPDIPLPWSISQSDVVVQNSIIAIYIPPFLGGSLYHHLLLME